MKKKSCVGWESFPGWMHKIDTDSLGNATGCHLKDGSQSWYCSECRYKDGGEMIKMAKVIVVTWQSPSGDCIDVCKKCQNTTPWPKDRTGQEYCMVKRGAHHALRCDVCGCNDHEDEIPKDLEQHIGDVVE